MASGKARILLIEDEESLRIGVRAFLKARGYEVAEAGSCREGEAAFRARLPDCVVLDWHLPDGTALDLLRTFRDLDENVPILVLTGQANIDLALKAISEGAQHFLTKPVPLPTLEVVIQRMLEGRRDRKHRMANAARHSAREIDPFVGRSAAIRELARRVQRVASSESPVLLIGETGTGKTLLASWMHARSSRREEAFVDLNCAALPGELLETELFGHERGAFTGAVQNKPGLIEAAHRGTLFLDEIGDLALELQPKLLKVVEEARYRRVGSVRDHTSDVRLIAATNQELGRLVQEGRFRSDLYFRISIVPLRVPSLRERREDVPLLAELLLSNLGIDLGRPEVRLSKDALAALARHEWPGNVRELRNVLERALLFCDGEVLGREDLWFEPTQGGASPVELDGLTLEELERRHIDRVLRLEGGRVTDAAARLGIPRSTLYKRMHHFGLGPKKSSTS